MISFKLYYEANIANAEALKNEIIDLLQRNSRRKPNLEPSGPIYKWFTNNLMKWLTAPDQGVEVVDGGPDEGGDLIWRPGADSLINLEPHEYREGEPEWMKKPDVMDHKTIRHTGHSSQLKVGLQKLHHRLQKQHHFVV